MPEQELNEVLAQANNLLNELTAKAEQIDGITVKFTALQHDLEN